MKKNDWYIFAAIVLIAFGWLIIRHVTEEEGAQITVTRKGEVIGVYELSKDERLVFTGENGERNVLVIEKGAAYMSEADCPDKLCVKQKAIARKGESIICLPHRLVVEVTAGEEGETDAVTG